MIHRPIILNCIMPIHAAIMQTFIYTINNCGVDAFMNSKKWEIKKKG